MAEQGHNPKRFYHCDCIEEGYADHEALTRAEKAEADLDAAKARIAELEKAATLAFEALAYPRVPNAINDARGILRAAFATTPSSTGERRE